MAKTKQEFYNEGVESARTGLTNGKMPAFGERDSWQGRAFAEGFNAGLKEVPGRVSVVTPAARNYPVQTVNHTLHAMYCGATAPGEMNSALRNPTLRAVSSHVLDLLKRADTATPEKALRYRAKAEAVFNRHAYA